ncbi:(2Fe-2S)-binding protein [Brevibacillus gelatini]|uniref:(2Fe-2S)-binding protein n=1 Tax=Brevibacillus gelatini TaxID=1655277 RepID=A0A3M8B5B1_9BACL|nr:2Fe-2S iron-sulfur cluster-binding protein [Brevibacillus gelatini]RNB58641.1 (2Fe-2S)-binding protein [Brevibacillus gelatini]
MTQLTLITRSGTHDVPVELNETVVAIAKKHKVTWGHACQRGLCAQCRTQVLEGASFLNEITSEEKLRLRKAERAEGFRLGCQIMIVEQGNVKLAHRPY